MTNPINSPLDRRSFLKKTALGAGLLAVPSYVVGQSPTQAAPNSRLNLAIVGVGGRGRTHTVSALAENVVALCDVDMGHVNKQRMDDSDSNVSFNEALTTHEEKGAKWFKDYRVMFEEMGDKIDAVIVATPDHMHFPIALSAVNLGKHVYCEKPLTHTVEEARILAAAAKKAGIVSQMGNQGHSNSGLRIVKEWLDAGIIGEIKEVHSWTDRPAAYWEQGLPRPDHSKFIPVVPKDFDWNLWLGVAEERPYDPAYAPFDWRAYLDFGCGALGDMGCHIMDAAHWGMDLGYPERISATASHVNGYTFPKATVVSYDFPANSKRGPVNYKWYSGGLYPSMPDFIKDFNPFRTDPVETNGSLFVGEGAAIITDTYAKTARIIPREKFMDLRKSLPPQTLPRIESDHFTEWTNAIRESRPASSDFSYAGPFTETVLLGVVAIRTGRDLHFDTAKGVFKNDAEANALMSKKMRDGWIIS